MSTQASRPPGAPSAKEAMDQSSISKQSLQRAVNGNGWVLRCKILRWIIEQRVTTHGI